LDLRFRVFPQGRINSSSRAPELNDENLPHLMCALRVVLSSLWRVTSLSQREGYPVPLLGSLGKEQDACFPAVLHAISFPLYRPWNEDFSIPAGDIGASILAQPCDRGSQVASFFSFFLTSNAFTLTPLLIPNRRHSPPALLHKLLLRDTWQHLTL
jgi:hypothetical protein